MSGKYGQEMLKSSTYRKVLKSECLKRHGLETGIKVFEEIVFSVTGSYDYCHKTVIEEDTEMGFAERVFKMQF